MTTLIYLYFIITKIITNFRELHVLFINRCKKNFRLRNQLDNPRFLLVFKRYPNAKPFENKSDRVSPTESNDVFEWEFLHEKLNRSQAKSINGWIVYDNRTDAERDHTGTRPLRIDIRAYRYATTDRCPANLYKLYKYWESYATRSRIFFIAQLVSHPLNLEARDYRRGGKRGRAGYAENVNRAFNLFGW